MVVKSWISTKVCPDLSGTIYLHSRTYCWKGFGAERRPQADKCTLLRLGAPSIEQLIHPCWRNLVVTLRATLSSRWFHRQADLLCEASLCLTG